MRTPELLEGEHLRLHVVDSNGRVVLDFGKPISHLELEPEEAEQLSMSLAKFVHRARVNGALEAARRSGQNQKGQHA